MPEYCIYIIFYLSSLHLLPCFPFTLKFILFSSTVVTPPTQINTVFLRPFSVVHMSICLELTTWDQIICQGLVPRENWLTISETLLIAYIPSCTGGPCEIFPCSCWHTISYHWAVFLFKQPYCWDFLGATFLSCEENYLWMPWSSIFSVLSYTMVPES